MSLPSFSGIVIPSLSGTHTWTREHFVNRPDIEFLRDSNTGMEVYPGQNFFRILVSGTTTITWFASGDFKSGVNIFVSGGGRIDLSGNAVIPPNISGIAAVSGLPHL